MTKQGKEERESFKQKTATALMSASRKEENKTLANKSNH